MRIKGNRRYACIGWTIDAQEETSVISCIIWIKRKYLFAGYSRLLDNVLDLTANMIILKMMMAG